MYRLCNLDNPDLRFEAATLDKLFDFRINGFANLQSTAPATPLQFNKWLSSTIDDSNWEQYLGYKLNHQYSIDMTQEPKSHFLQLFKMLFKDRPKWLLEYAHLSMDIDSPVLRYMVPTVEAEHRESAVRYTEKQHSIPYTGFPTNVWAERAYLTGTVTFSDAQLANANIAMDNFEAAFTKFFAESTNRDFAMDWDLLSRNNMHSTLIKRTLHYLQDKSVIRFVRSGRDVDNIRPSTAYTRWAALHDDLRPRATISVETYDSSLYTVYKEPRTPATRAQLSSIMEYRTNVLDMLPFHIRGNSEQKSTLYGVELEACSDYSPTEIIAAQQELFFILKNDGSISGDGHYKYEMVTVPATFKAHKRLWAEFFNKVDYTKFDTSRATTNGMHVHIDRKAFNAKGHLNRFTWFFINPANFDFLFEVSERPTKNDMQRWAGLPSMSERVRKPEAMRNAVRLNTGMRGAIHFKGNTTVEIRMFKGVVSFATVVKNLEFVDSLVEFTAVTSLMNVTLPNYLAWLAAQPKNRYSMIREFISQLKNIEQTLLANELKEYLFTTAKPEAILDKLQKAKFKVSNKHLTILNREKRKRTFVLGKDGTVQMAYSNTGKLASFDKSMQAKLTRGSTSINIALI